MSNSFNASGNIARDGELKNINGNSILNFVVANSVGFGDKKTTLWLDCSLFGKRAESVAPYIKKGQSVFISGELSTREYAAKDGSGMKTALSVNVVFVDLTGKKSDGQQPAPVQSYAPQPAPVAAYVPPHEAHRQEVARHNAQPAGIQSHAPAPVNYDDDIPF